MEKIISPREYWPAKIATHLVLHYARKCPRKNLTSIENIVQVYWENACHFLPDREKLVMKKPSCRWMINALQHLLNFYK